MTTQSSHLHPKNLQRPVNLIDFYEFLFVFRFKYNLYIFIKTLIIFYAVAWSIATVPAAEIATGTHPQESAAQASARAVAERADKMRREAAELNRQNQEWLSQIQKQFAESQRAQLQKIQADKEARADSKAKTDRANRAEADLLNAQNASKLTPTPSQLAEAAAKQYRPKNIAPIPGETFYNPVTKQLEKAQPEPTSGGSPSVLKTYRTETILNPKTGKLERVVVED